MRKFVTAEFRKSLFSNYLRKTSCGVPHPNFYAKHAIFSWNLEHPNSFRNFYLKLSWVSHRKTNENYQKTKDAEKFAEIPKIYDAELRKWSFSWRSPNFRIFPQL